MAKILKFETKEAKLKRLSQPPVLVNKDGLDPLTAALKQLQSEYAPKELESMFDEDDDLDDVEGYVTVDEEDKPDD